MCAPLLLPNLRPTQAACWLWRWSDLCPLLGPLALSLASDAAAHSQESDAMAANGASQLVSSLRNSFARKPRTETEEQLDSMQAMQEKLLPHHRVQGVRLFVQQVREEQLELFARLSAALTRLLTPRPLLQLQVLIKKNYILTKRNKAAAIMQVLSTFIFILLIYGVAQAIEQVNAKSERYTNVFNPDVTTVTSIPDCSASVRCEEGTRCVRTRLAGTDPVPPPSECLFFAQLFMKSPCFTFGYAPTAGSTVSATVAANVATNIAANIMASNSPAITSSKVIGFPSPAAGNTWLQASNNTQRILGIYEIIVTTAADGTPVIDYGIQVNASWKFIRSVAQDDFNLFVLPMQVAIEREIARYLAATSSTWNTNAWGSSATAVTPAQAAAAIPTWSISTSQFAHPAESSFSLVGAVAPTFLLAAAMFVFTTQVYNLVIERELKLRSSMRVMGVSDGVWWLSWALWDVCVTNVVSALLICAFGNAFPFDLFRRNQFSVVFIHFWLFEASLTALGYFLSTFIGKAAGSTFMGFTIFLFGFIFQLVVSVGGVPFTATYGGTEYGGQSSNGAYRGLQVAFSAFPPTVFAKGISDLGTATSTSSLSGIKWRTRDSYCYCNPAFLTLPQPNAFGQAPPSPIDFSYIYNNKLVNRNGNVCGAKDYADYRIMFPNGDCDYSINECWQWFILDFGMFMSLALIFDQVLRNEFGVRTFSIRSGYSWFGVIWFLAMLFTMIGVGASDAKKSGGGGGVVAAVVVPIGLAIIYSWTNIYRRIGPNAWFILSIVSLCAFIIPHFIVLAVYWICYGCNPGFQRRNKEVMKYMFPGAWIFWFVVWFSLDVRDAVTGCLSLRVRARAGDVGSSLEAVEASAIDAGGEVPGGLDDDVAAEEHAIKERLRSSGLGVRGPMEPNVAVEVRGLVKSFGKFHAVKGNFFRVETGKLFALLGPNGAGKTTTINLLTGVLPITSGDACVGGHSIRGGEMSAIRRLMGVCPQFDVLWGDMTAREHLLLFAALKGLPREQWERTTNELLDRTKLTPAADRRSSGFSGGMKRRLSVGIALIGDPEVVYLDEPTTGMDPITRRYVWDIILEAKAGRAIVLTTHSMEEADVLADNITIIAKGRLRCFGSSLRLKTKFGTGYRIATSVVPSATSTNELAKLASMGRSASHDELSSRSEAVQAFFSRNLGIAPSEVGRVYTTFTVPRAMEATLGAFLQMLQDNKRALGITDIQMSQTTLEQVFLRIARDAERQAAAAEGRTLVVGLPLEDGTTALVDVPWGAEHAVFHTTGEMFEVCFIQDDEGRLMYSYHNWRGQRITFGSEDRESMIRQAGGGGRRAR